MTKPARPPACTRSYQFPQPDFISDPKPQGLTLRLGSPARLARRELMRQAGEFHRQVLADPGLLKKYRAIARKKRINLSAATMGEVLRRKTP